jgi:hypothetical protein
VETGFSLATNAKAFARRSCSYKEPKRDDNSKKSQFDACAPRIRAFSSEVATGSREENASKQKPGASVLIPSGPKL